MQSLFLIFDSYLSIVMTLYLNMNKNTFTVKNHASPHSKNNLVQAQKLMKK